MFPVPPLEPPPPPIERVAPEILGRFPQVVRLMFADQQVARPDWVQYGGMAYRDGRIEIQRDIPDYAFKLRHELLHQIQLRYQPFSQDEQYGFPALTKALVDSFGQVPEQYKSDPYHAFVNGAEAMLDRPQTVPKPMLDYLSPLLAGLSPDRISGPR